tara:strand:- start:12 stop:494 length:483 start_codon:yes stop_codon:yes gene_type:complete
MVKKSLSMYETFKSYFNYGITSINNSQFFIAIIMLIMNVGSKYIAVNFSKTQEAYLKMIMGRHLLIFSVAFMATRNFIVSLIVLLIFVILADYAFNENSRFCVLPKTMKKIKSALDTDGDGKVSQKEIEDALKLLTKAKEQKAKEKHIEKFTKFKSLLNI